MTSCVLSLGTACSNSLRPICLDGVDDLLLYLLSQLLAGHPAVDLPKRLTSPSLKPLLKHLLDCLGGQKPCRYRPLGKVIGERQLNYRHSRSRPRWSRPRLQHRQKNQSHAQLPLKSMRPSDFSATRWLCRSAAVSAPVRRPPRRPPRSLFSAGVRHGRRPALKQGRI